MSKTEPTMIRIYLVGGQTLETVVDEQTAAIIKGLDLEELAHYKYQLLLLSSIIDIKWDAVVAMEAGV